MKPRRVVNRKTCLEHVIGILEAQQATIAFCLMKRLRLSMQEAIDLIQTTLAELFLRYRHCQWPKRVRNWGAYLSTCAFHAYTRPAVGDERLLIYAPPIEDPEKGNFYCIAPDPQATPDIQAERSEMIQRVRIALAELDTVRRMILVLWSSGYKLSKIGKALGISAVHARVLKHEALRTLRLKLVPLPLTLERGEASSQ